MILLTNESQKDNLNNIWACHDDLQIILIQALGTNQVSGHKLGLDLLYTEYIFWYTSGEES